MNRGLQAICGYGLLASCALASDVLVYDSGTKNGGDGPRQYAYVVVAPGKPIMQLAIGVEDGDPSHFTNVVKPAGWSFQVDIGGVAQHFGVSSLTGEMGEPGIAGTPGRARWFTTRPELAVEAFEFGFDHPWSPGDVGWYVRGKASGPPAEAWLVRESWDRPVGTGEGPVHGPTHHHNICMPGQYCGYNYFCQTPPGACQELRGECTPRPDACTQEVNPVCGCNGLTYGNYCEALAARVSVAHRGVCGQPHNPLFDYDADGVLDGYDNCRQAANPGQTDADADFVGDDCDDCGNTIVAVGVDAAGCPPATKADFDLDGDADESDFDLFHDCVTGPALGPSGQHCAGKDYDLDGDVDQSDFAVFQRCLSGANVAADPACR